MLTITEKIDEIGKPAWIGLMVLSFVIFWPVGLALLAFLIWSGRMGHRHCREHWRSRRWDRMMKEGRGFWHQDEPSSGNRAFDEYRADTLRRLEEEHREFQEFLDRLRYAKDKAEFDDFLASRRDTPPAAPESPAPTA